ncbi:MAG TPA: protein kinase [Bryobacteraceae bacterium]|nr:protein kinase [Bryobacteraceae bacterium]
MTQERWRQVDDLFQQAAEVSPEDRNAFLTQACGQDEELRREVELLLRHDNQATGPQLSSALQSGLRIWAARGADLAGTHAGPYRILKPLGRGGMGAVYLAARDDDQFRKQVAIKLVRSDMDTEMILKRFRQERQILANLQHPNIAQLYDGGVTADGLPYFALEYIEGGKPITAYCKDHNLSVPERLRLFRDVCAAVQYAHQNLVVHRDLKPGNILVTPDGIVKLLDFGVAKLLEASPVEGEALTNTGVMMITPEYASPEQVRGEAVTTTSDVYMLGAVLFELLTGEQAHKLNDYSPLRITEAVCHTATLRPSEVVQPSLRRRLEGDLDNIVLMALRKERERRYPSVEAMAEDIRRHLEGLPISAREDTLVYRSGKFLKRNRVPVAAAALIVASLAAGIGAAMIEARRAERRFQQVRKLANTFLFSFHDKIQNLQGSTEAREFVVKTALEYLDSLAGEAGIDSTLQNELANAYLRVAEVQGDPRKPNLGHTEAAFVSLGKAIGIAEGVSRRAVTDRGALRVLAQAYAQQGDMKTMAGKAIEGAAAQQKSVNAAERLCRQDGATADDLMSFNQALLRMGDSKLDDAPKDSLSIYGRAMEVAVRLTKIAPDGKGKLAMAQTRQRMGRVTHNLGDPQGGVRNYEEAERLMGQLMEAEPKNARYRRELMVIYNFLGNYWGHEGYFSLGRPETALAYYRKAAELQQQSVSGDPKDVRARVDRATGAAKLGEVYLRLDRAEAVRQGRACDTAMTALIAEAPEDYRYLRIRQNCLSLLGRALLGAGRYEEALRVLMQTLELSESLRRRSPNDVGALASVALSLLELVDAHIEGKQWDLAAREVEQALELLMKAHQDLPTDLFFLRDLAIAQEKSGRVREGAGNRAAAKQWYQKALASWEQWRRLAKEGAFADGPQQRVQAALDRVS